MLHKTVLDKNLTVAQKDVINWANKCHQRRTNDQITYQGLKELTDPKSAEGPMVSKRNLRLAKDALKYHRKELKSLNKKDEYYNEHFKKHSRSLNNLTGLVRAIKARLKQQDRTRTREEDMKDKETPRAFYYAESEGKKFDLWASIALLFVVPAMLSVLIDVAKKAVPSKKTEKTNES